ncbi:hypothetical protein LCGC14_1037360 [marine sediment metagenome]|uniref:Uncharacterized protein n=1 Tax=marine sediment metagenome TaxID=412755 RepID=A0A0F9MSW7_9ZZZZ
MKPAGVERDRVIAIGPDVRGNIGNMVFVSNIVMRSSITTTKG